MPSINSACHASIPSAPLLQCQHTLLWISSSSMAAIVARVALVCVGGNGKDDNEGEQLRR